jgi:hypothetical protein
MKLYHAWNTMATTSPYTARAACGTGSACTACTSIAPVTTFRKGDLEG